MTPVRQSWTPKDALATVAVVSGGGFDEHEHSGARPVGRWIAGRSVRAALDHFHEMRNGDKLGDGQNCQAYTPIPR